MLLLRYLHENVRRTRHRIDVAGAVAMFVAGGALILGLLQGGVAWPWWSAPSLAVFGTAVAAAAGAVFIERRAAEPIMPPWFWRRRVLSGSALAALGLGLLVIGPTTFLPTYGQAVLGLGAVAAGAVLGTMSIGWPLASSQSARLFLRAGFRDTQLVGAAICLVAVAAFLFNGDPAPVWAPAVETFVLGGGLGLLSVASIVGPQSTVAWGQRGVVTGTVMFCRYLGQSLGAAIFGAIFNAALNEKLHRSRLPARSPAGAGQRGERGAGPAAGTGPGRGGLPEGGHRHRDQPRVRRADRGGRADHRRRSAADAPALRHRRRRAPPRTVPSSLLTPAVGVPAQPLPAQPRWRHPQPPPPG